MERLKGEADWYHPMDRITRVPLITTKWREEVSIEINRELMRALCYQAFRMDKALIRPIRLFLRVDLIMERRWRVHLHGVIKISMYILARLKMICLKVRVSWYLRVVYIKASFSVDLRKVLACLRGQTVKNLKALIRKIKKLAMVSITIRMVLQFTRVNGRVISLLVKVLNSRDVNQIISWC
jgi:hypothetical protein